MNPALGFCVMKSGIADESSIVARAQLLLDAQRSTQYRRLEH
jgi:hypothetical protein